MSPAEPSAAVQSWTLSRMAFQLAPELRDTSVERAYATRVGVVPLRVEHPNVPDRERIAAHPRLEVVLLPIGDGRSSSAAQ